MDSFKSFFFFLIFVGFVTILLLLYVFGFWAMSHVGF